MIVAWQELPGTTCKKAIRPVGTLRSFRLVRLELTPVARLRFYPLALSPSWAAKLIPYPTGRTHLPTHPRQFLPGYDQLVATRRLAIISRYATKMSKLQRQARTAWPGLASEAPLHVYLLCFRGSRL
jgi:hypothetical protein